MKVIKVKRSEIESARTSWTAVAKNHGWMPEGKLPLQLFVDPCSGKVVDAAAFKGLKEDIFTDPNGSVVYQPGQIEIVEDLVAMPERPNPGKLHVYHRTSYREVEDDEHPGQYNRETREETFGIVPEEDLGDFSVSVGEDGDTASKVVELYEDELQQFADDLRYFDRFVASRGDMTRLVHVRYGFYIPEGCTETGDRIPARAVHLNVHDIPALLAAIKNYQEA